MDLRQVADTAKVNDPVRAPLRQVVLLGEIADLDHLDRRGRQRIARLIKQHGADMQLPKLAMLLSADCPKANAPNLGTRCFVCFPQLLARAGSSSA